MADAPHRHQLPGLRQQRAGSKPRPMRSVPHPLAGVFFDLDGTLVDSARDMHDALTALCRELDIEVPRYEVVRETVSRGARAALRCAVGDDEARIDAVTPRFLE